MSRPTSCHSMKRGAMLARSARRLKLLVLLLVVSFCAYLAVEIILRPRFFMYMEQPRFRIEYTESQMRCLAHRYAAFYDEHGRIPFSDSGNIPKEISTVDISWVTEDCEASATVDGYGSEINALRIHGETTNLIIRSWGPNRADDDGHVDDIDCIVTLSPMLELNMSRPDNRKNRR